MSNLETARISAGLSREQAAKLIGITSKQWCAYERDPLSITGEHMIDMCYFLGAKASYLYGFSEA